MREPGVENCRTAAACNVCTAACNVRHTGRDITPALPAACSMGRLSPSFSIGKLRSDPPIEYWRLLDESAEHTGPRGLCFNDLIKEVKERI